MAIGGGGKMAQLAGAFGERGNHCVAMGDGFVAGRFDAAGQRFGWMYCAFLHAGILAWGLRGEEFHHGGRRERGGRSAVKEGNLSVCTVLASQQRARWRNFPAHTFVLFING